MPHCPILPPNPPEAQSLYGHYICLTCGAPIVRLKSQTSDKPFCNRRCHYLFQRPLSERFWEKVERSDDLFNCWTWIGQIIQTTGYGRLDERKVKSGLPRRVLLAHRISWELHFGPIPDGLHVLHHCDNPPCVRPDHLFLGTQRDNNADKIRKQRQAMGEMFPHSKLTRSAVAEIRRRYAKGGISIYTLGAEFGVSYSVIGAVVRRDAWKHCE